MLILGANGMLGQALMEKADDAIGVSHEECDITEDDELEQLLRLERPNVVINCAAITSLTECENNYPTNAYAVNARAVAVLAELSHELGFRLIHISTDHFWTGDGRRVHGVSDRSSRVRLVNEYARTKYAGEQFALTARNSLVVRTNIVGLENTRWAIDAIEAQEPMTLYDDFITSPIDVWSFAELLLEIEGDGLVNLAGWQPVSKLEFVQALADALHLPLPEYEIASVKDLWPPRAESLALEPPCEPPLPSLKQVVRAIAQRHELLLHR